MQLYGEDNPALTEFLRAAGANPWPVRPYVYAPHADTERVVELIGGMSRGEVDVLTITSKPQVERLFEVAAERELQGELRHGLERTKVAAIGPVAAESLRQHGVRVDVCPEQGFVMKNLVQQIKRAIGPAQP